MDCIITMCIKIKSCASGICKGQILFMQGSANVSIQFVACVCEIFKKFGKVILFQGVALTGYAECLRMDLMKYNIPQGAAAIFSFWKQPQLGSKRSKNNPGRERFGRAKHLQQLTPKVPTTVF